MEKIREFISNHFDFKFYQITILPLIAALAIVPCVKFLPEPYGYENGVLENIQMLMLAIGFIMAVMAKTNKKFFYFAALVIILITAREINYGRTIFFPIPGEVNAYYSWKEIKYGWIVNPLIGVYITGSCLYFIIAKAYREMWNIIKSIKFPIWNFALLFLGMVLGEYAEKATENFVFEEIAELVFYTALVSIIWLYAFHKNFRIETAEE